MTNTKNIQESESQTCRSTPTRTMTNTKNIQESESLIIASFPALEMTNTKNIQESESYPFQLHCNNRDDEY